ncbi:hypothetical protein B9Z19DRAFT_1075067 [Tuber borchii]|uniref:Uncharacterized protein n=1 Tax=Tuber borchii TaxID=42251 RepID=A0A2T7A3S0_TUBBO|nr:hypothetical protein B9Z19DRAFT_1075067 [Tuber borchii]
MLYFIFQIPTFAFTFSFLFFSTFVLYAALLYQYSTCAMWWRSYHVGSCGFDAVVSFSGVFFIIFSPSHFFFPRSCGCG